MVASKPVCSRPRLLVVLLAVVAVPAWWQGRSPTRAEPAAAAQPAIDFNRQVRPILAENCFTCHGPDEKERKAKLRLDVKEGAVGDDGVIVPGNAAKSELIERVSSDNPKLHMPP